MCAISMKYRGSKHLAKKICKKTRLNKILLFQVEEFWVVTPCSIVVGYQRLMGSCYHPTTTQQTST
jgi:hypothetical protein